MGGVGQRGLGLVHMLVVLGDHRLHGCQRDLGTPEGDAWGQRDTRLARRKKCLWKSERLEGQPRANRSGGEN